MKFQILFFIGACALQYVRAATVNCDSQISAFRQCEDRLRDSRQNEAKQKMDSTKPAIEKCFKDNGCQVPQAPQPRPDEGKKEQCRKDINDHLKTKVQECVRSKTSASFTFPPQQDRRHDEREGAFRGGKKEVEESCGGSADKAKAVTACIKKSHQPLSEQQKKERFEKNCQDRKQCDNQLGGCRSKLDDLKKAVCQCNKDTRTEANLSAARTASGSCSGLPPSKKNNQKKQGQEHDCNGPEKDWCAEGYDAWKKEQESRHKGGRGGQ